MEMHTRFLISSLPTRSAAEVESMKIGGADSRSKDLQPPNRENVIPRQLLGQRSGRRSDSPSDGVTDSPSGGALRISDGHSDSPSGGTPELRSKLRPLYQVAHIRCQLSSRASPSRTSSCRNPDSLSALRNYFVGGREESQIMHGTCLRVGCECGEPLSTSIYRKRQGVGCHLKNSKCPCFMS